MIGRSQLPISPQEAIKQKKMSSLAFEFGKIQAGESVRSLKRKKNRQQKTSFFWKYILCNSQPRSNHISSVLMVILKIIP